VVRTFAGRINQLRWANGNSERAHLHRRGSDPHPRAFDADTGKQLWSVELPAGAQATPMAYEWNGKQYIVICTGVYGKMKTKMGDSVIAFAIE
jgi:glucose dehydrogenase